MRREDIDPELLASVNKDAAARERARIAALEAMRMPATSALVDEAISKGWSPDTVALQAFEIVMTIDPADGLEGKPKLSNTQLLADVLKKARGKRRRELDLLSICC
jgi:hypothetical protein